MKKFAFFLLSPLFIPLLFSCQPDAAEPSENGSQTNNNTPADYDTDVNRWIYDVMKEVYLWNSTLPKSYTAANKTPEAYFETLRYRYDRQVAYSDDTFGDRFSGVYQTSAATRQAESVLDLGFWPLFLANPNTGEIMYMQVLYVEPGSPADGKLERGDVLAKVGRQTFGTYQQTAEYLSRSEASFDIVDFDASMGRLYTVETQTINAVPYYKNPILAETIFEDYPATAYLCYKEFSWGDDWGANAWSERLIDIFARYKAAGVRNLVLDLRYNGGGELLAAQLLASLIARTSDLGSTLMYVRDNTDTYEPIPFFTRAHLPENANIEKLVILTSDDTASASELIIHCLKPFFGADMTVIGDRTVGKNLGAQIIEHPSLPWEIMPMALMVYNKNKISGYETGISPDVFLSEYVYANANDQFLFFGPLGDYRREVMLNLAMNRLHGEPRMPYNPMTRALSLTPLRPAPKNQELIIRPPKPKLPISRQVGGTF